ncbi:MAG: sigma factor, partial [Alphaproteobacteria bacterium]
MNHAPPAPLVAAYLAMREDLKRYFTLRLGSAVAADDLVQEIYLKVIAVRPDREIENAPAFLYRLGSNLMLDQLRTARRGLARDS